MKLKILVSLVVICIIIGMYFLVKKNQLITTLASEISQNKDIDNKALAPTTDSAVTEATKKIPEATIPNELKAGSFLETNGIKILSPKTGDEFTAGSSITIKYQILKPVKYGSIFINCNNPNGIAAVVIDESVTVGTYTKTCVLPDQVGLLQFAVNEMDSRNPDKLQSMFGAINLVAPNNKVIRLEVGDNNQIEAIKYGEDPGLLYLSQIKTLPTSVYVKAVFQDGKRMLISANDKNLSFKIADTTVASLSSAIASTQSFQVIGMRPEGRTDITVSYKGITKKIEVLTPACDITMPCY